MPPVWSFAADEVIALTRDSDVAYVQSRARAFVRSAGLPARVQWTAAIVASELATNVLKYGPPGTLTFRGRDDRVAYIEIEADDRGTGFVDIERSLRDGISEGRDHVADGTPRAARRGLGLGLGAVRRLTHMLTITPRVGGGTTVVARIEVGPRPR